MTRSRLYTPRTIIVLLLLGVVFALTGTLRAQEEDILYLYYFESDDANLTDALSKEYAFSTLAGETVTIMVYGLDQLVKPKLTLFNDQGVQVGQGFTTEEQPYATLLQFNASRNELYFFRVERLDGEGGLARVMIYEGDPLDQDLTLLDDMNPLLPSRTFMVAGRDTEEGLRVLVEVLDVPYYDEKPQIYASRGTLNEIPGVTDRFAPSDTFLWFNQDGQQIYFVNMRPTPEESTAVTQNVPIRMFNVGGFFYFDYYFTVGAGSDPVRLLGRQECATAANRLDCVRESSNFGRSETDGASGPLDDGPTTPTFDPLPPIQACLGGIGLNLSFTVAGSYSGSNCDDILNGSAFNDAITAGPGNDAVYGNGGDDSLLGDDGDDNVFGGLGNDTVRGGGGNDTLSGNGGNDSIYGDAGIDVVDYTAATGNMNVDLTGSTLPTGGTATGEGADRLFSIENVLGSNFDDTLLGNADANLLVGNQGNDTIDGGGGNDTLNGGEGNDQITIGSAGGGNSQVLLGNGNDLVLLNGTGNATLTDFGGNNGNDTLRFSDTTSGTYTYYDYSGDDVLDFTGVTSDVQLNLSSTSNQNLYGTTNLILPFDDPNVILGGAGNDTFTGSSNYKNCDFIDAGAGDDVVFATLSNGNFDNCTSAGSAYTNDILAGGIGNDLLSYQNLSNVNVNLVTGTATKNGTMGDNISGFENVTGSSGNDTITGDAVANILRGIAGNDSIVAGAGDDTIIAGIGVDTIDGGADVDLLNYSDAAGARNILLDGTVVLGQDVINNVENVIGTSGNDTIRGNTDNNSIDGGLGNDSVVVSAGVFGTDDLVGNTGRDTLNGNLQAGNTTVNVDGSTGTYNNANGTVNFVTTEVIVTGAGNDSFQIANGLTLFDALGVDGGGGVNTYNFDLTALGYIIVTPQVNDTLTVSNASAAGFSGTVINQWQQIITGLWVYLTAPINAQCGTLGSTNFINGTPGNDTIGGAPSNLTSCQSDDVFNGFGSSGGDELTYATLPNTVLTLLFDIDDLTTNQIATVTSTGYDIGTDTIIDFDRIVGTTIGADTFRFNPLTNTMNLAIDGNGGNDSLDFGAVSDSVFLFLDSGGFYTNLNLTLVTPIRDVLLGTGDDYLEGTLGNDTIRGNTGNDEVYGFSGNDSFVEGAAAGGADSYYGGSGFDTFEMTLDGASDSFDGGSNADSLTYITANPVIGTVGGSVLVIDGAGTDTLSTIEQITTGTGADSFTVVAGGTNLTLLLQDGNDTFSQVVDAGAQSVDGGNGNNTAIYNDGTAENIAINGATISAPGMGGTDTLNNFQNLQLGGNDDTVQINAAGTTSLIDMGAGVDTVFAYDTAAAGTTINGGAGVDDYLLYFLTGDITAILGATNTVGNDTFTDFSYVYIGDANNTVTFNAGSGISTLLTGNGNDTLTINSDTLPVFNTGAGNDSIVINQFTSNTIVAGSGGNDTLQYGGAVTNLTAALGAINDTVTDGVTTDTLSGIEVLTLTGGSDTINATDTAGLTLVDAAGGNDIINASSAGTTTLAGGTGNDTFNVAGTNENVLTGDAGDDVYLVTLGTPAQNFDAGTNTVIGDLADYSANLDAMTVTVNAVTTTITAGAFGTQTLTNFENLVLGTGADVATVVNDGGIESVNFGGGADSLVVQADAGNNTFDGDAGTDTADYSGITGDLTILLQANTVVGSDTLQNFEGLVLGNANYDVTNNAGSPFTSFSTGSGNDTFTINLDTLATINTGAGADSVQINAMTGNSTINASTGMDTLNYNTGATVLTVALGATNTVSNGASTDTFTGVDILTLDNANDIINALGVTAGVTVNAGTGNDSFTVGATNGDALNGDAGNDTYTVAWNGTVARFYNGAANTDLADYSANTVNFTGTVNAATVTLQVGASSADTLTAFENLLLGTGADTLTVANDGGIDSVNFGNGNDSLVVNADAGNNTFDGAVGTDTADYSAIVGNLAITLQANTVIGSDTLLNFEGLVLGNADYTVTENAGSLFTSFTTGTGDDSFSINSDTLGTITTGLGDDTVEVNVSNANSTINMGVGGTDELTYSTGAAVTVALGAGTVSDGTFTDTYTGVEILTLDAGNDTIDATVATTGTTVNAGAGNDSFTVGATNGDTLNSEAGDDTYTVIWGTTASTFDAGAETVADLADYSGNADNFTVAVGATTTIVVGASPADTLTDFEILNLGTGNDSVAVNTDSGLSTIGLGGGDDSITINSYASTNTFIGGAGTDTLVLAGGTGRTLTLGATNTVGVDTLSGIEVVTLTTQADTVNITNPTEVTTVNASDGNDTINLNNNGSVSAINAGNGADSIVVTDAGTIGTVNGDAGNDTFVVTLDTSNTTFNGGADVDTATYASATANLAVAVNATTATVNNGANTDTLQSIENVTTGTGNDVFTIDLATVSGTWSFDASSGANQFVFINTAAANTALINITATGSTTSLLNFSGMTTGVTINTGNTAAAQTLAGGVQIWLQQIITNVIGSANADNITGTASADFIQGGGGGDVILGQAGNDTLVGGTSTSTAGSITATGDGADSIVGGANDDLVIGGNQLDCQSAALSTGDATADGADTLYGGSGNDTILGDAQILNCTTATPGTEGGDLIYGGVNNGGAGTLAGGTDSINGQGGADTIYGGNNNTGGGTGNDGSDTIVGGTGNDSVFGGNNNNGGGDGNDAADNIDVNNDGVDTVFGGNSSGGTGTSTGSNTITSDAGDTTTAGNQP